MSEQVDGIVPAVLRAQRRVRPERIYNRWSASQARCGALERTVPQYERRYAILSGIYHPAVAAVLAADRY